MKPSYQARGQHWKRISLAALLIGVLPGAEARCQPLPLPLDLQVKVDKAIDNGVTYLKSGMWPGDKNHMLGYVALPGLTLLECGVPANHQGVQNAAAYVRAWALRIDTTYEIALSVLFLDKLGDAKDRDLIQKLALRLIAGQGPTGGWSYKCPPYDKDSDRYYKQLFATLKRLDVPVLFDPLTQGNSGSDITADRDTSKQAERAGETPLPVSRSLGSRNWAWCIKMENPYAETLTPNPHKPKVVVIPRNLQALPVLHPPAALPLVDPKDKINEPIWGTTDNSNTQFAILALWAARRHQVPTARTLNLIAMRFYTSQNADGSWGYHYRFGGGDPERPPMTCVGLLGLAVYHGLVRDIDARAMKGQDPRIVKGLLALTKNVGVPTGRAEGLGMANLYFLWSVERVGVLYDLPTIGNKEWYRWGAEILVANQTRNGNWENGGYHGASPTIDSCLALLFLKRANLSTDLTKVLPFKPAELNEEVAKKLPRQPEVNVPPPPPVASEPSGPARSDPTEPSGELQTSNTPTRPPVRANPLAEEPEERASKAWIWLLGLLALVIGGGVALALLARNSEDDEEDEPRRKASRRVHKKARH